MVAGVPIGRTTGPGRGRFIQSLLPEHARDRLAHERPQLVFVKAHRSPR
jgi:hypothetical protein